MIWRILRNEQDRKNKSFRELAVFQASLDLIIPKYAQQNARGSAGTDTQ